MKQELSISGDFTPLLEVYGTKVKTREGNTYYELPFWFQMVGGGWKMFIKMPEDLKTFIVEAGLGGNNPQSKKIEL